MRYVFLNIVATSCIGFCILGLTNCADLGKVVDGNTRHQFGEYDFNQKREYRRFLDESAEKRHEKDEAIVTCMEEESQKNSLMTSENVQASTPPPNSTAKQQPLIDELDCTPKRKPWFVRTLRSLFRADD